MGYQKKKYQNIRDSILNEVVARDIITDRNVGSVTRTLVEAYAKELAILYEDLDRVYHSAFIDSAEGDFLDHVVAILGIKRIDEDQALGSVIFSRQSLAEGKITIPKGTIIAGSTPGSKDKLYETTEEKDLAEEQNEIEVPVRALVPGEKGVVEKENVLTILPRPIVGIKSVTNPEKTILRARKETDSELRERTKNALRNTGKATNDAIVFALRQLGAQSVQIFDYDQTGAGIIEVVVDGEDLDNENSRKVFRDAINATKAAGIKAYLQVTNRKSVFFKLKLSLKKAIVSKEEINAIKDDVSFNLESYFNSLDIGETVRRNRIILAVLRNPHVLEIEFLPLDGTTQEFFIKTGSVENGKHKYDDPKEISDRTLANGDLHIKKFERAVLALNRDDDIEISERSYPVYLDLIDDRLIYSGNANVSQGRILELVRESINKVISDLLDLHNRKVEPVSISYEDLKRALDLEEYTLKVSHVRFIFLHTYKGLEVTLIEPGQKDIIYPNEFIELTSMDIQVDVIPQ